MAETAPVQAGAVPPPQTPPEGDSLHAAPSSPSGDLGRAESLAAAASLYGGGRTPSASQPSATVRTVESPAGEANGSATASMSRGGVRPLTPGTAAVQAFAYRTAGRIEMPAQRNMKDLVRPGATCSRRPGLVTALH